MSIGLAIVLGITQGISELFPFSSLGILVVLPAVFHLPFHLTGATYLPFIVALHVGTALGLLLYFLKDWIRLVVGAVRSLSGKDDRYGRILGRLFIATVPAGIAGYLFKSPLSFLFGVPLAAAVLLIANGGVLFLADAWKRARRQELAPDAMTVNQSLSVGLFQMFALFPGLSRSGLAMTGALRLGLSYEEAARFAFLMATPIIGAAGLLELPHLGHGAMAALLLPSIVGGVVAAVVAVVSVHFLLRYFERQDLRLFAWICVAIGVVSLLIIR